MEDPKYIIFLKSWFEKVKVYVEYQKVTRPKAILAFITAFIFAFISVLLFTTPTNFPVGDVLTIRFGESLQSITVDLKNKNIIGSELVFRSLVILFGGEKKVIAGDYLLSKKESSFVLARRLVNGVFQINTIKITIPEGWNVFQIGDYLEKNLLKFNKKEFVDSAKKYEGYLFPDTYFVSMSAKPADIIELMKNNFNKKILQVANLQTTKKSISDIIIMASILEGEALPKDKQIVAGILWKRIAIGMPLQVDATFKYINGKNTYELTLDDLKIDSPYNTYTNKGLPIGPISNPGIDAIIAAYTPIKTNYLYFLTEKDGTIHYAKTFAEHIINKQKYLK